MDDQEKLKKLISRLENYITKFFWKKTRKIVLKSVAELFPARENIVGYFKKGIFPFKSNVFKTKKEESEENKLEKIKDDYIKFFEYIENESKGINYELFKKHCNFVTPTDLARTLYQTKNKKEKIS